MGASYSWEDLRVLSLARQFPHLPGRDAPAVADAVGRIGPIQSQTARSPYVGLGARLPGVTHAAVSEAYESLAIVRGSTIRGTVHTSTASHHALLDVTTRVGQRTTFARMLKLDHTTLEEVWAATESHARDEWRSPTELTTFLSDRLAGREEKDALAGLDSQAGRYLAFGHGGLLRRPIRGDWSGQGAPGYRTASALLPDREVSGDPLLAVVRVHVASYGPSSRQDIAWWSGLGLRQVDGLLERLELTRRDGPDGRSYVDLVDPPATRDLPGVRLLPEFDALLCGYDPRSRERFVSAADNEVLWHRTNGFMLAPVLVDGRIGGWWRLDGGGRSRRLEITRFAGSRKPRVAELEQPLASLAAALGVEIGSIARA